MRKIIEPRRKSRLRRQAFKPRKFSIKRGSDGRFHVYAN